MTIDPNAHDWSIMVQRRNGAVNFIRDLTLLECRRAYERLDPWFGIHKYKTGEFSSSTGPRRVEPDEVVMREVFGPPEWDSSEVTQWDRWPKESDKWFKTVDWSPYV